MYRRLYTGMCSLLGCNISRYTVFFIFMPQDTFFSLYRKFKSCYLDTAIPVPVSLNQKVSEQTYLNILFIGMLSFVKLRLRKFIKMC